MRRFFSGLFSAIGTAILVIIIVVAGGIFALQLLGHKPMAILSGSMEPRFNVGGVVFINTKAKPEDVILGDVITFSIGEDTLVTHRVTQVGDNEFRTKGDANNAEDLAPVPFDAMIGSAWLHIPKLGYALMALGTRQGFAAAAIIAAIVIALFTVSALLAPPKKKDDEQAPQQKPPDAGDSAPPQNQSRRLPETQETAQETAKQPEKPAEQPQPDGAKPQANKPQAQTPQPNKPKPQPNHSKSKKHRSKKGSSKQTNSRRR
jgi:signal peptidase